MNINPEFENEFEPANSKKIVINYKLIIPILLALTVVLIGAVLFFIKVPLGDILPVGNNSSQIVSSNNSSNSDEQKGYDKSKKIIPETLHAATIVPIATSFDGEINVTEAQNQLKIQIDEATKSKYDAINVIISYKNGQKFASGGADLLDYVHSYCHKNGLQVVTTIDLKTVDKSTTLESLLSFLSSEELVTNTDMVIFSGFNEVSTVITSENLMKEMYDAIYNVKPSLYTGVYYSNYFADNDNSYSLIDGAMNFEKWTVEGYCDFVVTSVPYSTLQTPVSFESVLDKMQKKFGDSINLYCEIAYSKLNTDENWKRTDEIVKQTALLENYGYDGFIIDRLQSFINDTSESRTAFEKYLTGLFNSKYILTELTFTTPTDKTFTTYESSVPFRGASDPEFSLKLNGEDVERNEFGYFSITKDLKVGDNKFVFEHKGVTTTYNIKYIKLVIKGYSPDGKMTVESGSRITVNIVALSKSTVTATFNGQTYSTEEFKILDENGEPTGEYSNYYARITMPTVTKNTELGKITIKAVSDYGTETETSGTITVKKAETTSSEVESTTSSQVSSVTSNNSSLVSNTSSENSSTESSDTSSSTTSSHIPSSSETSTSDVTSSDSSTTSSADSSSSNVSSNTSSVVVSRPVAPSLPLVPSGDYVNVGNTMIAEVVTFQAETFNMDDYSDYSRPTNNYLPKGTVDYCKSSSDYYGSSEMRTLRYGKMLYTTHKNVKNIAIYNGILPDHNEIDVINFTNGTRHTELVLDVLWKAPFKFELKDQKYKNEGQNRDYTVSSITFSYIDITFCYTTLVVGDIVIPADNPIFKSAEWIKNAGDYTLRLHLKKVGAFYGWNAEYNSKGQLVFSFLNPAKITAAENNYGYRLDGIVVAIDVGHGGEDPGALGSNNNYTESKLNLILANKLKAELESIGATVVMTRYNNDVNPTADDRILTVKNSKADFAIAIHRNSSSSSSPHGFQAFHFNAYTINATNCIFNATMEKNLYGNSKWNKTNWHVFYTSRTSDCPVVLTECGFVSNASEYKKLMDESFNNECAIALTQGIVDYFVSINK